MSTNPDLDQDREWTTLSAAHETSEGTCQIL